MVLYDSFVRNVDTFVSSHFQHKRDACGYGSGGSGGESDQHERMKEIALHKLQWEFDLAASRKELMVGENIADVYSRFEDPHDKYGYGIIVEVQHKNKDKDIEGVTQNYLEHGYSVCWVWDEQYEGRDVDLFGGQVNTVWPEAVPRWTDWELPYNHRVEMINSSLHPWEVKAPARLPTEWYDETSIEIWRSQMWEQIFCDSNGYDATEYIQEVRSSLTMPDQTEIRLSPDIIAKFERDRLRSEYGTDDGEELVRRVWRSSPWEDRFTEDARQYIPDSDTGSGEVVATLPFEWLTAADLHPNIDEITNKIVRIVDYNSGNGIQPEMAAITSIKQIASHAGIPTKEAEIALGQAISTGILETKDGRVAVSDQ